MATVNFYLKEPKAKTETLIILRFHYEGSRFKFSTGEKIHPKSWNPENQRVKKSFTGSVEINSFLDKVEGEIRKVYRNALTAGVLITREFLHTEILKGVNKEPEKKKSFFDYYNEFIEIKKATLRPNTIKKFRSLYNHLKEYEQKSKSKLTFEKMDVRFQEQFTAFLITEKHHLNNSVGKYFSALKTFLHWGTERGYNSLTTYRKFKILKEDADIIYLSWKELMNLNYFDLKGNQRLEQVRDVFCFGCFTGLRFSDIAQIREENLKGTEIHLRAKKTKDSLTIPLNGFALEILKRNNYRLPAISNQKTNLYLKEMGKIVGIDDIIILTKYRGAEEIQYKEPKFKFLTSHTARRTFVTLSLENGMRAEVVMSITGHKKYDVFKKYVKLTSKVKQVEMERVWEYKPNLKKVV